MFKWAVVFFIIGWIDVSATIYNDDRFSHFEKLAIRAVWGTLIGLLGLFLGWIWNL
jgi:hypothetical protein